MFDPRWRTETVLALALARGIEVEAAFDRLPVLADALEEAGCDHLLLLHHCRHCSAHTPDCWAVSLALDRVPTPAFNPVLVAQPHTSASSPAAPPSHTPSVPGMPTVRILWIIALVGLAGRTILGLGGSRPSPPPPADFSSPRYTPPATLHYPPRERYDLTLPTTEGEGLTPAQRERLELIFRPTKGQERNPRPWDYPPAPLPTPPTARR